MRFARNPVQWTEPAAGKLLVAPEPARRRATDIWPQTPAMPQSLDECPECKSDDLEVVSLHDIRPPRGSKEKPADTVKPVA